MIEVGMMGRAEAAVTVANTAAAVGSGSLSVFATPCMAALMEQAAVNAISPALGEGESSVGTRLEITHDAATPVGMDVWAEAQVTAVDGKRICFTVRACDGAGQIGGGTHERFLISVDRFLSKAARRKEG